MQLCKPKMYCHALFREMVLSVGCFYKLVVLLLSPWLCIMLCSSEVLRLSKDWKRLEGIISCSECTEKCTSLSPANRFIVFVQMTTKITIYHSRIFCYILILWGLQHRWACLEISWLVADLWLQLSVGHTGRKMVMIHKYCLCGQFQAVRVHY